MMTTLGETQNLPALQDVENELIGLHDAKQQLRTLLADLSAERARSAVGAVSDAALLHMSFTGNAGTGKTTFAQKTADVLHRLGYIEHNRLTMANGADLNGQYFGHAAARARDLIKRALGGVLFIDEPYLLNRPELENDFGREAIDVLTDAMRNRGHELVVILAGPRDRMDALFEDAPRLRNCIAHHMHFPDYSHAELLAIGERMLDSMHFELDASARAAFADYLERRVQQPHFANARSVRNALDRARLRQASRLFSQSLAGYPLDTLALARIQGDDLPTVQIVPAQSGRSAPTR
jgi:probable Rubsico expression protein CbbX